MQTAEGYCIQMLSAAAVIFHGTVEMRDADGFTALQHAVMHDSAVAMSVLVESHVVVLEELAKILVRVREIGERRETWLRNALTLATETALRRSQVARGP